MAEQVLIVEKQGAVARLVLNRPSAMNALNSALVADLHAAISRLSEDPEVRVLVVTGNGQAFCAGADLKDALATATPVGESDFLQRAGEMMRALSDFPRPVIAVLNGITMAGGLELAMCADIVIAAENAQIGDAHANYGVFPGAGGAAILPRLIPLQAAMYMLLTGKTVPAQRLYELGLISELHTAEDLDRAASKLASKISSLSPLTLSRMKEVARSSAEKSRADALRHEQVMLRRHLNSIDLQEGLLAFKEKRAPNFIGR